MNIYIGNFSYDVTETDLQEVLSAFGTVESVKLIKDKFTGESKGFGFVEMPDKTEAMAAIDGVKEVKGKKVTINEARPQVRNSSGPDKRGGSGSRDRNFGRREKRY